MDNLKQFYSKRTIQVEKYSNYEPRKWWSSESQFQSMIIDIKPMSSFLYNDVKEKYSIQIHCKYDQLTLYGPLAGLTKFYRPLSEFGLIFKNF